MTRRRREKPTIPAPAPSMAELAAEAHARLEQDLIAPVQQDRRVSAPILCGWCQRREGPQAKTEHKPCSWYGCECLCRSAIPDATRSVGEFERFTRSHDVTQAIEPVAGEDPRDGSGVRDAISQDPALAGLLEDL